MGKTITVTALVCASLILVGVFTPRYSAAISPQSVAAAWLFDEGDGNTAKDSSGNDNDGTLVGPEWDTGVFGGALRFDGVDDYVDCGNDESLNLATEFSLVFWMNHPPGTEGYNIIKNTQDDVIRQWGFLDYTSAGTLSIFCNTDNARENLDWTPNLDDNDWHHLVLTINGATGQLFVDGVSLGTRQLTAGIVFSDATVWIGKRKPNNFAFTGLMDEVAVFNVALNVDEVNEIMNSGLARAGLAVSPAGKLATSWANVKNQR